MTDLSRNFNFVLWTRHIFELQNFDHFVWCASRHVVGGFLEAVDAIADPGLLMGPTVRS